VEVVDLERDPLSLVSKIEDLLGRKSSSSGLVNRDYGRRGCAALTTRHPSILKKIGNSPISGGRSVGIVRSRTKATELLFDRLCSLVVRVPAYKSRGPGSIPGNTRFSEK
jgi:hypothetical protein